MNEFDLIAETKARAPAGSGIVLGIDDDAAVLQPSAGMQLIATTDNLVAGRHFVDSGDNRATPEEIGHLALAANLSDLAAMGAIPRWCLLTLTLPEADSDWLRRFLDGFLALAVEHDCALVGGNITRGPTNIGVTALGEVPAGKFATRSGAHPGQRIVVTGTLGDAAAGLKLERPPGDPLRERLLKPAPRIAAGLELARLADAMIDISDGLLADLAHMSGKLGAEIHYELLALVAEDAKLPASVGGINLTEIGRITNTGRIGCLDAAGELFETAEPGWDHFRR